MSKVYKNLPTLAITDFEKTKFADDKDILIKKLREQIVAFRELAEYLNNMLFRITKRKTPNLPKFVYKKI